MMDTIGQAVKLLEHSNKILVRATPLGSSTQEIFYLDRCFELRRAVQSSLNALVLYHNITWKSIVDIDEALALLQPYNDLHPAISKSKIFQRFSKSDSAEVTYIGQKEFSDYLAAASEINDAILNFIKDNDFVNYLYFNEVKGKESPLY